MERTLILGALTTGIMGWLCALLLTLGAPASAQVWRRDLVALAVSLPLVVWLLTLPTAPPFSPGQGFGRGALIGGAAALLSAFVVWRGQSLGAASALERIGARAAAGAPMFAALAMVCVPLLWMRPSVVDALMGAGASWVGVSLLLLLSLESSDERAGALPFGGAAFGAALCGAAALGVYRDFVIADTVRGTYPAVVAALAASASIALLVGAFAAEIAPASRPDSFLPNGARALFCLALPLGVAVLLALRVTHEMNVVWVVATGALLGVLLWWLSQNETAPGASSRSSLAAVVVALCAFMLAYQLMQGLGVGLMLLAAWPFAILAIPATQNGRVQTSRALSHALSFATVLLLSRLFDARFAADLRGASFDDQYALFGFVAGAALPALCCALLWPNGSQSGKNGIAVSEGVASEVAASRVAASEVAASEVAASGVAASGVAASGVAASGVAASGVAASGVAASGVAASEIDDVASVAIRGIAEPERVDLLRAVGAGALGLALVAVALVLWGAKIAPAFFAGLGLSAAGLIVGARRASPAVSALFALALAVSLCQWTHHFAPISQLSRLQRLNLVAWTLGVTLVLLLVADYGARLMTVWRARRAPSPQGVSQGVTQ